MITSMDFVIPNPNNSPVNIPEPANIIPLTEGNVLQIAMTLACAYYQEYHNKQESQLPGEIIDERTKEIISEVAERSQEDADTVARLVWATLTRELFQWVNNQNQNIPTPG